MLELKPACPPGASLLTSNVCNTSDAPWTAAARPEGPAPTMIRS
jgi:hypothetical protein